MSDPLTQPTPELSASLERLALTTRLDAISTRLLLLEQSLSTLLITLNAQTQEVSHEGMADE